MSRTSRNSAPSSDLWAIANARNAAEVHAIASRDDEFNEYQFEDSPPTSKLFELMAEKDTFVDSTNFSKREVLSLYQDAQCKFASKGLGELGLR